MGLHISSLGTRRTLMCVLCNKASSLLRSDTYVDFYWYSDLISHTHTHTGAYTHTHSTYSTYNTHSTLRDQ